MSFTIVKTTTRRPEFWAHGFSELIGLFAWKCKWRGWQFGPHPFVQEHGVTLILGLTFWPEWKKIPASVGFRLQLRVIQFWHAPMAKAFHKLRTVLKACMAPSNRETHGNSQEASRP